LPGRMLVKVDRASMANSLEVRTPFLDHALIEWAAGLPVQLKIKGNTGKYVLRKALERQLPTHMLYRSKQGFSPPLKGWLAGNLRHRLRQAVQRSLLRGSGLFDMTFLQRLVAQHSSGLYDYSPTLWALIMFESCLRTRTPAVVGHRSAAVAPAL